jgi:hypothetical protein
MVSIGRCLGFRTGLAGGNRLKLGPRKQKLIPRLMAPVRLNCRLFLQCGLPQ